MNAPFDRLQADLADLAEQVTVVDLRDRTLRTSRKLGARRAMLVAAAAVAVLAIGAGSAFAVLPGRNAALPASPGPSGVPTAAASASVAPPSASPSTTPSAATSDPLPGMYLFREDSPDGTLTDDVWYRPAGGDWRSVATVNGPKVQPPDGPPPIVMAPDRQHIAWYLNGTLQVSALDGGDVKTLSTDIGTGECNRPAWTADSRQLLVQTPTVDGKGTTLQAVSVDGTGRHMLGTYPGTGQCDITSSDGASAYTVYSGKLVALDGGGAGPRTVPVAWPTARKPAGVVAVSVGATRLLVSTVALNGGCGCSPPQRYAVVDPATGRVTSLDNVNDKAGSAPVSGAFTKDGRVVLIADRNRADGDPVIPFLTVFDPDGSVIGTADLPPMEYGHLVGLDS